MAPKPFRVPPQPPPLFNATEKSLIQDARSLCDEVKAVQDRVVQNVPLNAANFTNSVQVMTQAEDLAALKSRIICFYQAVSIDAKLRDASSQAEEIMDNFNIESSMREDVFKVVDAAYQAIKENKTQESLSSESLRLLEKERDGFIRNGLGIEKGEKRDRFKDIKKRLSQLQIEFSKNLNEENGGIWFSRDELDGVPEDLLETFEKGTDVNEGKLRVTFKYPDMFPTLKFALSSETRKKMTIENENKNVPLFKETIILRDEAARLLGYPNHAAFRISDKMAKEPAVVIKFLTDLKKKLTAGGLKQVEHLMEIKTEDLKARGLEDTNDGNYYLWDTKFYNRMMVEKEFYLDEQKVAEYFPLQATIHGMLKLFEELFGLTFVEILEDDRARVSSTGKGKDIVWHEDVKIFAVWDEEEEEGGFIGYLYLDLHPRQGKYAHAANFSLQPGFSYPNGTRRYPATALVCNFSKPTKDKPSLLKHDEVVTLFHELGHGIHDLTARTQYSFFHGTSVVRDFVETPSQMLENWCWAPSQLKSLSSHYKTGASIPDDLIDKLVSTKHINGALLNLRQLHFGIFDMTIHTPKDHEEVKSMNFSELFNELRTQISGIKGPEALGMKNNWGNGQATFGHLIGGYDAGYYGYLSSEVYSTDIFHSFFKDNPIDGKQGRRYRHMVLEKGGSQDEMKTLVDFLGRQPSNEPFYKELGLS